MSAAAHGLALVLNCGSSSIKFQVIDPQAEGPLAVGLVERVKDHAAGVAEVIACLEASPKVNLDDLTVVGHRVVQGGSEFTAPTIIDDEVERAIALLAVLAPLHNPAHAAGIRAAREAFPHVPHVAVFDTAFHQSMPEEAYTYALDRRIAQEHSIRKYGFHGTSHAYVARATADAMGRDVRELNQIVLHLGNGASACAVKGGRSYDTSMGFTPLEGLVMGSRTGDIDPAVVAHLGRSAGMTIDEIDDVLNKRSGMLGLTGYNDMRDVRAAAEAGDHAAQLGLAVYCRRIKGYVGRYYALLGHLDSITFTAGVGENDIHVRAMSLAGLEELGIIVDAERNHVRPKEPTLISTDDSRVQVWVVPTNEEREIAIQSIAAVS